MPPHADRAAGTVRPPGERLRRRRLQRIRSHTAERALDGAGAHAGDRCHPLSADADHVVVRGFAANARDAGAQLASRRSPGIHMEGPYLSPDDGDARRASAANVWRRDPRRLQPSPGRGGRTHRARHARAGSPWRDARSSNISSPRASASRSATPPRPRQTDRATRSPPARRWPRTWATAARRCCPAIRTSSGNCSRPTPLLASVIVDGHHLPPATVKAMMRAKGARRNDPRHRRRRRRRLRARDATRSAASSASSATTAASRCRARRTSPVDA